MAIGLQESNGSKDIFFIIFMVLYLKNALSQHANIDMIFFVDYIITTKVKISQLEQQTFMMVGFYQSIQMWSLLFLFVLL